MTTENGNVLSAKRLSKDTLLYIPVFLAPAIVNILLLMIFTRLFPPNIDGQYTIVMHSTLIVSALFLNGLLYQYNDLGQYIRKKVKLRI